CHTDSLSEEERKEFEKFERPKTERQMELLGFANAESSRLMREAGLDPYDVPLENFHILPVELYRKMQPRDGSAAATIQHKQEIIFNGNFFDENIVKFGSTAFHELLHL